MSKPAFSITPRPLTGTIVVPHLATGSRWRALGGLLAVGIGGAWSPVSAEVYDLNFRADNISMWSPGQANVYSYKEFLGASWNVSASVGSINTGLFGIKSGAKFGASTSGRAGIDVSFESTSGDIDVQAPYRVTVNPLTDLTAAGTLHRLSVGNVLNLLPNQSLVTTNFPSAEFSVEGVLDAKAEISGEVALVFSAGAKKTLFDFETTFPIVSYNENSDGKLRVFGSALAGAVNQGSTFEITSQLKDTILPANNGTIKNPFSTRLGSVTVAPRTFSALSGASFTATGQQNTVLNMSVDVLGAASSVLGLPFNPFDLRAGAFDFEVRGTLLAAQVGISLGLAQDVTFTPDLHMALRSSELLTYRINSPETVVLLRGGTVVLPGGGTQTVAAGGSIFLPAGSTVPTVSFGTKNLNSEIQFTKDGGNQIDLLPEFFLVPKLNNNLDLVVSHTSALEAMKLSISIPVLGTRALGPLFTDTALEPIAATNVLDRNLDLSSIGELQQHVLRRGLTSKAPTISTVLPNEAYDIPSLVGGFSTATVGGLLRLSSGSAYTNDVLMTVGERGKLHLVGSGNLFQTPALATSGGGAVDLAAGSGISILNANGWADMTGTKLDKGNYIIYGDFTYSGGDIVTNALKLEVGGSGFLNLAGGSHPALRGLASNTGTLTFRGTTLAGQSALTNAGTLVLAENATVSVPSVLRRK